MNKIYCYNAGNMGWGMLARAIADDGTFLAIHNCSSEAFMRRDLGMDGCDWQHEKYNQHFGIDKWELVWIDNPDTDERLKAALELNKLHLNE